MNRDLALELVLRAWPMIDLERFAFAPTPPTEEPPHPESICGRCGGPNVPWSAPSPLWNEVIRGGSINGIETPSSVVCPTCFAVLAEEKGVASLWRLSAERVNVPLETVTPSGRVWNPETWRFDDTGGVRVPSLWSEVVTEPVDLEFMRSAAMSRALCENDPDALLDYFTQALDEIVELRAAYERVVAERNRARRCLQEHADCDEPECQVEIEAALGLGDDPMEIRANMAEAERDRLRSDLNQATAVVEAAKAWFESIEMTKTQEEANLA